MAQSTDTLIIGEHTRALDERNRLAIPLPLAEALVDKEQDCILAKERTGCLSLWRAEAWKDKLQEGIELIQRKLRAGKMEGRLNQVQNLGRLLSTRHRDVKLDAKGRMLIPEGFREFLGVEPGGEVMIVGAAVCVEIWNPAAWLKYLDEQMPEFNQLFDQLSE